MFKDDRLISVLTAVVLMLVIGTFAQRFDPAPPVSVPGLAFGADDAMVRAGGLARIDVLANDAGVPVRAASGLVVTVPPPCGRLFVQGTALQYLADPGCIGPQVFGYGLRGVVGEGTGRIVVLAAAKTDDPGALTLSNTAVAVLPDPQPSGLGASDPASSGPGPVAAGVDPALTRKAAAVLASAPQPSAKAAIDDPVPLPAQRRTDPGKAVARPTIALPLRPTAEGAPTPTATSNRTAPLRRPADAAPGIVQAQSKTAKPLEVPAPVLADITDPPGASTLVDPAAPRRVGSAQAMPAAGSQAVFRAGADAGGGAGPFAPATGSAGPGALPTREAPVAAAFPSGSKVAPSAPVATAVLALAEPGANPSAPSRAGGGRVAAQPGPAAPQITARPVAAAPDPAPERTAALTAAEPERTVALTAAAPERTAALTAAAPGCTSPVRVRLDPGPAAVTGVSVEAPCAAHSVAELAYAGLRLALVLDGAGRGRIDVPVLAPNAPARLSLVGGAVQDLTLTARDVGRVERVAVGWTDPVSLTLHAREFGGPGEVSATNPGDPDRARRLGGGFLTRFAPIGGQGQSVQIYSYVRPTALTSGVIDLALGYDLPPGGQPPCLRDPSTAPRYTVLRLGHERPQRPLLGQMPGTDCTVAGSAANPGAPDAAHDLTNLIITPR